MPIRSYLAPDIHPASAGSEKQLECGPNHCSTKDIRAYVRTWLVGWVAIFLPLPGGPPQENDSIELGVPDR
jgi:hypothetical protein